jgi:hypothetical protein
MSLLTGQDCNFSFFCTFPVFFIPGKKDFHTGIPAGFMMPGWPKPGGEKCLGLRGLGRLCARAFPLAFWQSERNPGEFPTGRKTKGFTPFSGNRYGKISMGWAYFSSSFLKIHRSLRRSLRE